MTIEFIKKAKKDQKTGEENISKIVTQKVKSAKKLKWPQWAVLHFI